MSDFDPYHKWLGIPPRDQPPNHYRLLGIEVFESDPDVIDAAAEQRASFVRQCVTGKQVRHSQQILNEIAVARLTLLKETDKRTNDLSLRRQMAAATEIRRREEPNSNTSPSPRMTSRRRPVIDQPESKPTHVTSDGNTRLKFRLLLTGIAFAFALIVVGIAVFSGSSGLRQDNATTTEAIRPLEANTGPQQSPSTDDSQLRIRALSTASSAVDGTVPEGTGKPAEDSVVPINPTVTLEPLDAASVREGEVLRLIAKGKSVGLEENRLRYYFAKAPPDGCQIDEQTGVITWVPNEAQGPGEFKLTVSVSSLDYPLLKDQTTAVIRVLEVNEPPSLDPIADQTIDEGSKFTFTVKARDVDEPFQQLRYSLQTNEPTGAIIDARTGKIEWTPLSSHVGRRFTFRVSVTEIDYPKGHQFCEFYVSVRRSVRVDLILVQNTSGFVWDFLANQTPDELQREVNEATATNRRPTCVSGYLVDNQVRFASIWINDSRRWKLHFGMDRPTRHQLYALQRTTDRTVWTSYTGDRSHVIIVETPSQPAYDIRDSFTGATLDRHIEDFANSSNLRPVAVWQEAPGRYGVHLVAGITGCNYRTGITAQDVAREIKTIPQGDRPIHLDGIGLGASRRYSLVMISDGTTPKWDVQLAIPLGELERNLEVIRGTGMMPLLVDIE